MRPKLIAVLLLAALSIASSAYYIIKKENEKIACTKKCGCKKPALPVEQGGQGDELLNASFNHLIVSTFR